MCVTLCSSEVVFPQRAVWLRLSDKYELLPGEDGGSPHAPFKMVQADSWPQWWPACLSDEGWRHTSEQSVELRRKNRCLLLIEHGPYEVVLISRTQLGSAQSSPQAPMSLGP